MKTSNKILTITMALLLGCLAFYDFGLKAEYKKGDYLTPYYGFTKLNYSGFDVVELNSSSAINIMLVQGPFKVMASSRSLDYVNIRKEGNRLIIDAKFPNNYRGEAAQYLIYLSCPRLSALKADAYYTVGDIRVTDTAVRDINWRPTVINGFVSDSLNIIETHAANVMLVNNTISHLRSSVGVGEKSGSALIIDQNNRFHNADIEILNRSRLWIKATGTQNLNYHIADSASLIVNGAEAKHLLNLK